MRIDPNHKLLTTPIAHRGLWNDSIIENSLSAYENAVKFGYPIEIDVYSSTDGEVFCFHDKTLNRMTGTDGFIYQKSSEELKKLRLSNSNEKIPTLREVLSLCKNNIPILLEIKNQPDKKIVSRTLEILKEFNCDVFIQSFNPYYIKQVKKQAPEIIRGILATNNPSDLKNEKPIIRWILKRMPLNFIIKPDFISFIHTGFPLKKRKIKNKALLAWTITNNEDYAKVKPYVNNVIFEHFIPKP